ncbi:MAG TPA: DUF2306 domain-containing protein [Rudaea sp.]|nr:DUF2306 domain-containing protein [Rudaea sp.]
MSAVVLASPDSAPIAARAPQFAARALRASAAFWLTMIIAGQLMFAIYIVAFYGRAAALGRFDAWNKVLAVGYVPGDTGGNLALALHLAFAAVVTFGGTLQLVPWLRGRWPRFHRWNGRVFVTSAVVGAITGAIMIWTRNTTGDFLQHVAITIDAALILGCAGCAWRDALARRFDAHRRWALRLFLCVSAGWFFRIGLMLWIVANGGPVGFDPKTFTGPFLTFLSFAQFLLPLAVLELYFHAQARREPGLALATAALVAVLTLAMTGGIAAATAIMWLPHL